jgi:predicted dehydrogenase
MNYNLTPKRFLLIGCGSIAKVHARVLEALPESYSVPLVCDVSPTAANEYAARFRGTAFNDYRLAISAAVGKVDGVLMILPHFLHFAVAKTALEAGLPVLVEKPVVCNLTELRALQALERPGVFVQAGQMQRFGDEENWLKDWLGSGEFGTPRLFNLDIYQNIVGYFGSNSGHWLLDKKTAGGGIVISVGIHILDLLRFWFDQDFTEVFAFGSFEESFKNGAESTVAATFKMSGEMIGTLNCSYTVSRCPYSQRSLVFGSRGTLYQHMDKPGGGYMGPFYISTDGGKPMTEWGHMYDGFVPVAERRGASRQDGDGAFAGQLAAFSRGIEEGAASENSLARNLNTIAVIEALGESLLSNKPESVPTA